MQLKINCFGGFSMYRRWNHMSCKVAHLGKENSGGTHLVKCRRKLIQEVTGDTSYLLILKKKIE